MSAKRRAKPALARACRSKYLGAALRLRGRAATVTGCALPKERPAPKPPVARFRVTYASGNVRPVPRSAVYRAARCSVKPASRGCAPLDIERAPWLATRPLDESFDFGASRASSDVPAPWYSDEAFHAPAPPMPPAPRDAPRSRREREELLARFDRGDPPDTAEACFADFRDPATLDAWDLARHAAASHAPEVRRAFQQARGGALAEICSLRPERIADPDAAECGAFYAALSTCRPTRLHGRTTDTCPMRYDEGWRSRVLRGDELLPTVALETMSPHRPGKHRLCYYGESMRARRRLRERADEAARAAIPDAIRRWGPLAEERWVEERVRDAESRDPRHVEWWNNDLDVIDPTRRLLEARGFSGKREGSLENLAFRLLRADEYGQVSSRSGHGEFAQLDEGSIADELWTVWVDEQSSMPMGKQRIAAMRAKHKPRYGPFSVDAAARDIARTILRKIRSGERHVGHGRAGG